VALRIPSLLLSPYATWRKPSHMSHPATVLSDSRSESVALTQQLRRAGWLIVVASLGAIAFATLLPEPGQPTVASPICLICGSYGGVDAVLNVLLFLPLGVGLALAGMRRDRALLAMCGLSLLIETTQYFAISGRDGTIGDLLTNSIGGALGFTLVRYARAWLNPSPRSATILMLAWSLFWLALQAVSSFAFVPSFPATRYYGQIARPLPESAVFQGQVREATIGSTPVPDFLFTRSSDVQHSLSRGTTIWALVVPDGLTSAPAPILRIADSQRREIIFLAQRGKDMVFGARSGAALLRLRPPLFSLPGVFHENAMTNPEPQRVLRLSARYESGRVLMRADEEHRAEERAISLTPSLAWMVLLPSQWYVNGTLGEHLLTWIWIGLSILPFGYWTTYWTFYSHQGKKSRHGIAAISGLALVGTGFVIIPRAFGLSAESATDLLAALAGLASGAGLARVLRANDQELQLRSCPLSELDHHVTTR
jgi:VanZ like family